MKPDNKIIIKTLQEARGHLGLTAYRLGITYKTLSRWIKAEPELQEHKEHIRARTTEQVVDKLLQSCDAGNITAIVFYLKTQARNTSDYNFTERQGEETPLALPSGNQHNIDDLANILSVEQLESLYKIQQDIDSKTKANKQIPSDCIDVDCKQEDD